MQLIGKHSDYAIRALMALAQTDGRKFVSSRVLADADRIPLRFLRRILSVLLGAKFIEAKEGLRGGVRLTRPAAAITAAEVIRLFQGPITLSRCMFRKRLCANRAACVLRRRIRAVEEMVNRRFSGITIAALCRDQRRTNKRDRHEAKNNNHRRI